MERVGAWIASIPPVTRYWSLLIVGLSIYSSFVPDKKMLLVFLPEKAFGTQPWRLLTGFCYFGDFSIQLVINMFLSLRSIRYVEQSYNSDSSLFPPFMMNGLSPNQRSKIILLKEMYQTLDFLYFMVQISFTILAIVTYGFYKFNLKIIYPGMILDDSILYIWSRTDPNMVVNLFGFLNLRIAYLPFIYVLLRSVLEKRFLQDLEKLLRFDMTVFQSMFAWKHLIAYGVGHLWWFMRYFLLPKLYANSNKLKSDERVKTLNQYRININKYKIMPDILRLILLPPWYWIIMIDMKYNRRYL
ncbi:Der1-like family-domain-containing protein [Scheffersomyces coipomensis]|uniref:Der1-like family-domain-containing protein n=1 Tax=Scheffersomyces coipomensis TaxID=1788519 RepID=UPI00315DCAB8